jgi:hypothetical protein
MRLITKRRARRDRPTDRPTREDYAADLLPVEALGRDGLLIRSDGAFVRFLEVIPRNPLVMSEADCRRMAVGFTSLLGLLPAGQSVQF